MDSQIEVGGGGGGAVGGSAGQHASETMKLKSLSSSKSSINSENLYTQNLTFMQLFRRSIFKNVLLVLTIVAVVLGSLIGMTMRQAGGKGFYSKDVIQLIGFPGELFLRMLKMLILPLIIASVISALASLDSTVSGKIGMRACMFYLTTTVVATITGIILVTAFHPGDVKMKEGFQGAHGGNMTQVHDRNKGSSLDAVTDLIRSIVPDNIVAACFQHPETSYTTKTIAVPDGRGGSVFKNETVKKVVNREGANVLGLMFFCCIFGVICSKLGARAKILVDFFQALNDTVMKMVMLAMYFSPIGIMSLIIEKLLEIDDISETMGRLGMYMVTVIVGLILHGFISIPAMYAVTTKKNPLTFMKQCTECIVFAIGTGSSTATLPVTFKCLEENVKCDTRITRFVLPIGATINMDGTALYEAVAAIFIGQMNGMVFSWADLVIISLTSTAASFGAAAVPSAGLVTMIMVLTAVGLPTGDISMIVAVDWFL